MDDGGSVEWEAVGEGSLSGILERGFTDFAMFFSFLTFLGVDRVGLMMTLVESEDCC